MASTVETGAPTRRIPLARPRLLEAGLLLGFTLLVRAVGFGPSVINPDESVFGLAAREVLQGQLPYLTLFDNKPVGSTLILATAFALFGQSVLVSRLVGAAFVWATGLLVAALLERGGFSRLQVFVAALVYVAFASTLGLGGLATLTETLLTPFTAGAVLLLHGMLAAEDSGRRLLLAASAGLACGCAVAIKIVPVLPGLAVAATTLGLLLARRRVGPGEAAALAAVFGVVSALPMLVAAAVYAGAGALDEFLYANFGFARAYAGVHPKPAVMAQRLGTAIDAIWPLLALAAVALGALALRWRRGGGVDALALVAVAWLAAELAAASASLQFFPHYFLTALPPLAILSAYGLRTISRWIGGPGREVRAYALVGAVAALVAVERTQVDAVRERVAGPDVPRNVATAIRKAAGPRSPTLFVTSYKLSGVYGLAGAPLPPTRYAIPAHLLSRQSAMIRADPKAEVARILASRPEFIVFDDREHLPRWARAMFDDALARGYRPFHRVETVRVLRLAPAGG